MSEIALILSKIRRIQDITGVDRRVVAQSIAEHLAQVVRTELALELASN